MRPVVLEELLIGGLARHTKPLIQVGLDPQVLPEPKPQLIFRHSRLGQGLLESRRST